MREHGLEARSNRLFDQSVAGEEDEEPYGGQGDAKVLERALTVLRVRPIWVVVAVFIIVLTTISVDTIVVMSLGGMIVTTMVGLVTTVLVAGEREALWVLATAMIVIVFVVKVVEEWQNQDARDEHEEAQNPCAAGSSHPPQGVSAPSHHPPFQRAAELMTSLPCLTPFMPIRWSTRRCSAVAPPQSDDLEAVVSSR